MKLLLNLPWLVFGGVLMALGYAVVALVMFILIITIPFGIVSARVALFCLWPFGRTVVRRARRRRRLADRQRELVRAGRLAAGARAPDHRPADCITIVGIPLSLANFTLILVSLTPFGRDIVDLDQARRLGYHVQVAMPADPARREP